MATTPITTAKTDSALTRLVGLEAFPQPNFIGIEHPVVLMHGLGMMAVIRRAGHLHDVAMQYRTHGIRAFAPNVPPYNPVSVRANIWKSRIDQILEETRSEHIHLIAHSMGGLDARYLISKEGYHRHVKTLTTIATPHHGSSIANFVLEQPERLRAILVDFANWMGDNAMEEVHADFFNTIAELTPEYICTTFNEEVPDHDSVLYWSYAARSGKGTSTRMSPFLMPLNLILHNREGENDGFVSVESARWGNLLGVLEADHAQQLGLQLPIQSTFDSQQFYTQLAHRIAAVDANQSI